MVEVYTNALYRTCAIANHLLSCSENIFRQNGITARAGTCLHQERRQLHPAVLVSVIYQEGVDRAYLSGYCMTSRWKELCDTGGVETCLCETEGCS